MEILRKIFGIFKRGWENPVVLQLLRPLISFLVCIFIILSQVKPTVASSFSSRPCPPCPSSPPSLPSSPYPPCSPLFSGTLGLSFGSGLGTRDIVPLRLGVQAEFSKRWFEATAWPVSCYLEFSLYHLEGKKGNTPWSNARLQALALTPVFRFEHQYCMLNLGWPYLELAVGASLLSKKEIAGRELGTQFEFEDRLGAGIRFGRNKEFDFSYRFIHFSNAHLARENAGINLHFLILGYWF